MTEAKLERVTRIELAYEAWEAAVLPLNYTRIAGQFKRSRAGTEAVPASGATPIARPACPSTQRRTTA